MPILVSTFILYDLDGDPQSKHAVASIKACQSCCCEHPVECMQDGCGGFVHGEVNDEVSAGDDHYWTHSTCCDKCGRRENGSLMPGFEVVNAS